MDLRELRAVVAVVEAGSFTKAAAELHVAQPSLSQTIARLERELGVRLFDRVGRGVVLTAAGAAIVEPARQALRAAETARAATAAVLGLRAGRLDVACLPTLAIDPTAELVGAFRRAAPSVTVRLHAPEEPEALQSLVRSGTCELGVTEAVRSAPDDLVARELTVQDYVAVLPPGTTGVGRAGRAIPVDELAEMAIVTTPSGTSTRGLVDAAFAAADRSVTIAVETSHRDVIVPLVLAGAGVSVLPAHLAAGAAAQGAVVRAIAPPITRRVAIVARPGPVSPAAEAFLAISNDTDPAVVETPTD